MSSPSSCKSCVYSSTVQWKNLIKFLSQLHNKQTCQLVLHTVPPMPNIKQEALIANFKVIGLIQLALNPESNAPETGAQIHSAI